MGGKMGTSYEVGEEEEGFELRWEWKWRWDWRKRKSLKNFRERVEVGWVKCEDMFVWVRGSQTKKKKIMIMMMMTLLMSLLLYAVCCCCCCWWWWWWYLTSKEEEVVREKAVVVSSMEILMRTPICQSSLKSWHKAWWDPYYTLAAVESKTATSA